MLNQMMKNESGVREEAPPPAWGKGLAQEKSKKEQRQWEREHAAKPLAQYEDNAERDASMREVARWNDPMEGKLTMDKVQTFACNHHGSQHVVITDGR